MDAKIFDAASAYGAAALRGKDAGVANGDAVGSSAFGGMVDRLVEQTQDAVGTAEAVSAKAVAGQGDLVDVVAAISNAELVLETVTTVRDRVIQAYQDIMRMPI